MTYNVQSFQRLWNKAKNAQEVADKTGMSVRGAQGKARRLRAEGYRMRLFKAGRPKLEKKR